jgi:hypothetical protein
MMGADQGEGITGMYIVEVKTTAQSIRLANAPRGSGQPVKKNMIVVRVRPGYWRERCVRLRAHVASRRRHLRHRCLNLNAGNTD